MLSCEFAKCSLERVSLQTADVNPVYVLLAFKIVVLPRTHEGSECLIRYISVQCWHRVYNVL